jgi:pyruvate dehydrogenase E1 component
LNQALAAQALLEDDFGVAADVWSVTSYKSLYQDACHTERWNRLHPDEDPRRSYLETQLSGESGIFVAASDYLKALPASVARWVPGPMTILGTDGYGRSDTREALRDFFQVDARHIAYAAIEGLARSERVKPAMVAEAKNKLEIDPDKVDPMFS